MSDSRVWMHWSIKNGKAYVVSYEQQKKVG